MRRQTLVYCNECLRWLLGSSSCVGTNGSITSHALWKHTWLNLRSHHTGGMDHFFFSSLACDCCQCVLRRTQWWLGFDTSPLREAQRYVWGHHFMVGEGARPLKQDYYIASDSHFNEGKPSQPVPAVCVSWSHPVHLLACHVCLYSVWSQSRGSLGLRAHK